MPRVNGRSRVPGIGSARPWPASNTLGGDGPRLTRPARLTGALVLVASVVGMGGSAMAEVHRGGSWTRFGYNAARTNAAPHGLRGAQVRRLSEKRVELPGTVDSSSIYLSRVKVHGKRRSLLVVTTTYGRTLGLNPRTGRRLWMFTPSSYGSVAGSAQITTATPVADPSGRFVYTASSDGRVHQLRVSNGYQVTSQAWPVDDHQEPGAREDEHCAEPRRSRRPGDHRRLRRRRAAVPGQGCGARSGERQDQARLQLPVR
jgi:hypothetical protein